MKTLPDNPDLGHLKQQAKDLLAGLRDTDPATTLATAQKALATQYGFRTWTDLKAEVDRTRGRAAVADPALARAIADRYDLGAVTGEMRSLARPDESGRAWSLETDRGRWVARTMDTWWPIVDVEAEVALQQAAAAAGVLLPAPVRDRDGGIVATVAEHEWRVCVWAHSGPPMAAPASAAVTRTVGGILATIHGLALRADRVSPWHELRLSPVSWADLAARAEAEGARWAPALTAVVPVLTELDAVGAGVAAPPPVLSHNAMGPGQVRRGPGGGLVVTGWEHAGGQPPAWELANMLMDWTVDPGGGVNIAGARALVDGYHATAGTVPALDLAAFRGAVTGLMNYVTGQVEYALAATDDEDRRYADRSVRHLLSHLPTRAALEQLLVVARA
ncbi:phosphotransferase [Actinophytocola algeriensis]|uniref:Ser/Thr protein kinase RdoA (MazF antagonist) n=1 Tax=Actinophytocola algeriensis TaxID=1768010 RepID=A0A7W7QF19_9PSEU|nr:phosphotransferase [Actinophytocola algeriensis]MBB4912397.1 Ser/Thr protein kinase RdoA (MazF antagonist) [Actinophytocola algeriensis]MBE1481030.1 Ser/Thr protein kinase RdoA (MazF antagonist) [Actinophytocola algeriensis]